MKLLDKQAEGTIDSESLRMTVLVQVAKYKFEVTGRYNFMSNWFAPDMVDELNYDTFYDDVIKLVEKR